MQIFGLTPMDTALSVAGLKFCQLLMNFIFKETAIGVLGGVLTYLIILWKLAQKGQFRRFGVYFVSFIVLILVLLPSRQLMQFASAEESYGRLVDGANIEHSLFIQFNQVPVIYTFLSHGVDNIVIGVIASFDKVLPQGLKFLPHPYKIQKQVLHIREAIESGIQDNELHASFENFIQNQYLPAVSRAQAQNPKITFQDIQLNSDVIRPFYSSQALQEWQRLRVALLEYFNQNESLNAQARTFMNQIMNKNDEELVTILINAFASSIISKDLRANKNWFWLNVSYLIETLPLIHGAAQMLLAVMFPFIIMIVLIGSKMTYFWNFIRSFFWIKSWVLSLAMSSYLSLFIARLQLNHPTHTLVFFEQPFFSIAFVVLVVVFISLTRVIFLKGG